MVRIGIAGGGPAGLAAALWARRLGIDAFVLERSTSVGGQLDSYTLPLVDLPGFETAAADVLTRRLTRELERLKVPIYLGADAVSWAEGRIATVDRREFAADWFFYAPGLKIRRLNIAGEELVYEGSVSALAAAKAVPGKILVIGAGDRGAEGALRLSQAGHAVTLVSRSHTMSARAAYRDELDRSRVVVLRDTVVLSIVGAGEALRAKLRDANGQESEWTGSTVLVRVGMEPDVQPGLAVVRGDVAYSKCLRMTVIGDAALQSWERSLVSAFASAMQGIKRCVMGFNE